MSSGSISTYPRNHVEPQRFPAEAGAESCWRREGQEVHSLDSLRNRSLNSARARQGVDDTRRVRRHRGARRWLRVASVGVHIRSLSDLINSEALLTDLQT